MNGERRNRGWIWFFVVLAVLVVAALAGLQLFIRGRQLTLDQLQQARAVWEKKGPRNYDLDWIQKGSVPDTYVVQVRNGKAVSVTRNGQPVEDRLKPNYTMDALFVIIEEFLRQDAGPGKPKTFTTATFDAEDGHVTRFIRRVMGTAEQQDITVELIQPAGGPAGEH